jgi:hypothetical protein
MNILDFLQEKEELLIKKYVGNYSLKDFLGNSIQRLGHVETIVIDRTCLTDNNEQVIEAIKLFKSFSKIKVVFHMSEQDNNLAHELIGLGIFNIITESEGEKLREEIKMCLFYGMTEQYIKNKFGLRYENEIEKEEKEITFDFKEKQITIGIIGSQHRVGTTTIAMQFTTYLKSIGANVSYVEANNSGHLRLIAEHYKMKKINNGYRYDDISYEGMYSTNQTLFDFIIYDLGVLDSKTIKGFINCKIRVLCAGGKPYELSFLQKSEELLKEIDYNVILSGSEVNVGEAELYRSIPYNNSLEDTVNHKMFKSILDLVEKVNQSIN